MEFETQSSAVDLVRTALQSGSIKLMGPVQSGFAQANAEADVRYLATLISGLEKALAGS